MRCILFCVSVLICCCFNPIRGQDSFDEILDDIFKPTSTTANESISTTTNKPTSTAKETSSTSLDQLIESLFNDTSTLQLEQTNPNLNFTDCQCVPYYQCKTTGYSDTLDIRDSVQCESYLDFCCPKSEITNETLPLTTTGKPTESSGTCATKCVPYYLCEHPGSISSACENYLDVCCEDEGKPVNTKPFPVQSECGKGNPDVDESEENQSTFGEFPWMVGVLQNKNVKLYRCGGSLIHPQVVLTSAHCVASETERLIVRGGEWDASAKSEHYPHKDINVSAIITHPHYGGELTNNIALLVLEAPFEKTEVINTICLPNAKETVGDGSKCFLSGWGKNAKDGKYTNIMKKLELPLVLKDACQDRLRKTSLGEKFVLHDGSICAGGEGKQDACTGDQGDPLVCPIPGHKGQYYQMGIFSWGIGCGENTNPKVYSDVRHYNDWIETELAGLNFNTTSYKY